MDKASAENQGAVREVSQMERRASKIQKTSRVTASRPRTQDNFEVPSGTRRRSPRLDGQNRACQSTRSSAESTADAQTSPPTPTPSQNHDDRASKVVEDEREERPTTALRRSQGLGGVFSNEMASAGMELDLYVDERPISSSIPPLSPVDSSSLSGHYEETDHQEAVENQLGSSRVESHALPKEEAELWGSSRIGQDSPFDERPPPSPTPSGATIGLSSVEMEVDYGTGDFSFIPSEIKSAFEQGFSLVNPEDGSKISFEEHAEHWLRLKDQEETLDSDRAEVASQAVSLLGVTDRGICHSDLLGHLRMAMWEPVIVTLDLRPETLCRAISNLNRLLVLRPGLEEFEIKKASMVSVWVAANDSGEEPNVPDILVFFKAFFPPDESGLTEDMEVWVHERTRIVAEFFEPYLSLLLQNPSDNQPTVVHFLRLFAQNAVALGFRRWRASNPDVDPEEYDAEARISAITEINPTSILQAVSYPTLDRYPASLLAAGILAAILESSDGHLTLTNPEDVLLATGHSFRSAYEVTWEMGQEVVRWKGIFDDLEGVEVDNESILGSPWNSPTLTACSTPTDIPGSPEHFQAPLSSYPTSFTPADWMLEDAMLED
ncbi:hypothetical protein HDU67_002386 [Dinochytrium kinnereticum]|nr:hypothetical protein HDU67_002386 [Dinochytrium kinnereticum]